MSARRAFWSSRAPTRTLASGIWPSTGQPLSTLDSRAGRLQQSCAQGAFARPCWNSRSYPHCAQGRHSRSPRCMASMRRLDALTDRESTPVHCGRGWRDWIEGTRLTRLDASNLRAAGMHSGGEEGDGEVLQRSLLCHRPGASRTPATLRATVESSRAAHVAPAQPRAQRDQQPRGGPVPYFREPRGRSPGDVSPLRLTRPRVAAESCRPTASTIRRHAGR
jgi:hypothetical protein